MLRMTDKDAAIDKSVAGGVPEAAEARSRSVWWMSPWLLILVILAIRVVYLTSFNTLGLVYDEAHYWEWSRRLDWSYYTKGPGVAWAIRASTAMFGTHVWSVKLPAAIASAVLMAVGAKLASRIAGGKRHAGWYAAVALAAMPGYVVTSMLLTTDIFYSALWLMSIWCVYEAMYQSKRVGRALAWWAGFGFALGLAALFKYTAVLLIPGVVLACVFDRNDDSKPSRGLLTKLLGPVIAIVAGLVSFSPVIIWNVRHDWLTVAHQLGRVGAPGGDEPVKWVWSPMYGLSFWGAQVGLLAVVGVVLIYLSIRWAVSQRGRDPVAWRAYALSIWCAVPIMVFYLGLSLFVKSQGNWALGGYSSLLVLVGLAASEQMPAYHARLKRWRALPKPRPREGRLHSKPETLFQVCWHWLIGAGLVVGIVMMSGPTLLTLPGMNRIPGIEKLAERLKGRPGTVEAVQAERLALPQGESLPIICDSYQKAGLFAFYLPDRPHTFSAVSYMGGRPSAYDFFADTDLDNPSLFGRNVLLIGGTEQRWRGAFHFEQLDKLSGDLTMFLAHNYTGPKHDR